MLFMEKLMDEIAHVRGHFQEDSKDARSEEHHV